MYCLAYSTFHIVTISYLNISLSTPSLTLPFYLHSFLPLSLCTHPVESACFIDAVPPPQWNQYTYHHEY